MRPVPFVTNRPPLTGGFGPPPPSGVPEMLSFGTVGVLASPDRTRPGRLVTPIVTVGAVNCGATGLDAALVGDLVRALAAATQAGRMPLVIVHGGNTGFTDAVVQAADLCAWLETDAVPLAPIVFTWPSIHGPDGRQADQERAVASAQAWSRFLRAFATARGLAGQPRCAYLAQSMGVLVSQYGGRALAAIGGLALPEDLFGQTVLMGGADADAFRPGQGLDQLARISGSVVLGLGRVLPVDGPALPPNVRIADDWSVGTDSPARDGLQALLSGTIPVHTNQRGAKATRRRTTIRRHG